MRQDTNSYAYSTLYSKLSQDQESKVDTLFIMDSSPLSLIEIPQSVSKTSEEDNAGVLITVNSPEYTDILLSLPQVEAIIDPSQDADVFDYIFHFDRLDGVDCLWCGETVSESEVQFKYARKAVFEDHHPIIHEHCFDTLKEELNVLSNKSSELILSYTI